MNFDVEFYKSSTLTEFIKKHRTDGEGWYLRPGLFMHNEDVRTKVEVTKVGCSRLQTITEEDIIAEGLSSRLREHDSCVDLKTQFHDLWNSINGKTLPFDFNPWTFDYTFRKVA